MQFVYLLRNTQKFIKLLISYFSVSWKIFQHKNETNKVQDLVSMQQSNSILTLKQMQNYFLTMVCCFPSQSDLMSSCMPKLRRVTKAERGLLSKH